MAIIASIISAFDSKGFDEASKKTTSTQKKFDQFAKKAALAFAGVSAAIVSFGKSAAEDAENAQKLAITLKNVTGATDDAIASTEDYISKMTIATGVSDTELRDSLGRLVGSTKDVTEAQKLQNLALEISAGTGKDLTTVTTALAKANDGNLKGLGKLGITLGDNATNAIEFNKVQGKLNKALLEQSDALAAHGPKSKEYERASKKVNELQAEANDLFAAGIDWTTELGDQFGGQLAANLDTQAAKMRIMENSYSEAKETIGYAFLPILTTFTGALQGLVPFIQENATLIAGLTVVIGVFAGAIVAVNAAMKAWVAITKAWETVTKVATTIQAAWNAVLLANPIGLIIVAIVAVIAIFVVLYNKVDWVRKAWDTAFEAIRGAVEAAFNWIKDNWQTVLAILTGPIGIAVGIITKNFDTIKSAAKKIFNSIADLWNSTVGKLSFTIPDWVPAIGGKGFDVPDIPKLANGGIVTKPTLALIGEAGAEAVIPLSRGRGMGGNYTININSALADPEGVARAIKRVIQDSERRAGAYLVS